MKRKFRLGTRESALALWQANTVKDQLLGLGQEVELVPIKSDGDIDKEQPLYAMGITGIFTKHLDLALLEDRIDLAVHSMKDVPTLLPQSLTVGAVLPRGNPHDILVHHGLDFLNTEGTVATGSLRRKAQWLHRYPLHEIVPLRGNVETRLQKLEAEKWDGAVFAAAGLERLQLNPKHTVLNWMVPAPAQGAICVVSRENDRFLRNILEKLNHPETALCTAVERQFLQILEGGCSAPIGAHATIHNGLLTFRGELFSLDGEQRIACTKEQAVASARALGKSCAEEVLNNGGKALISQIKSTLLQ